MPDVSVRPGSAPVAGLTQIQGTHSLKPKNHYRDTENIEKILN